VTAPRPRGFPSWFVVLCVVLGLRAPVGAAQTADACSRVVIVIPRDGWRLTIATDGSASINYAALPQTVDVPSGVFRAGELYAELRPRLRGTRANDRMASVECHAATRAAQPVIGYLDDETFAAAQFERAWTRMAEPQDAVGREHVDTLRQMWDRRDSPRARK
jgi:hypothetical protein